VSSAFLESCVDLVDVGLVMLVVMQLHRLGIDVGLEGFVRVGEVGHWAIGCPCR
jgi:hypothetical protein